MRFSITQKRVTPEQQRMGLTEGDHKARLVAMDIKSKRLVDPDKCYAPVPGIVTPGRGKTSKCRAVPNFHVEITIGFGIVLLYVFLTTNF